MQPITFNNTWYQFDPVPRFFTASSSEVNKLTTFCTPHVGSSGAVTVIDSMNGWLDRYSLGKYSDPVYKEKEAFRVALETQLNSAIASEATRLMKAAPPKYVASEPAVVMDGQKLVQSVSWFDGYFDCAESEVTNEHLRLFVATPLFKGPGRYELLCSDRRIITFVVDRKPVTDVYFQILAKHSNKGLGVADASTAYSAKIVQLPAGMAPHTLWRLDPISNGYFQIVARHSGQALNVPGGSVDDGVQIVQWPANSNENDDWSFVPQSQGYYQIVSRRSGKCLAVANASQNDAAAIVQVAPSTADHCLWRLAPL